MARKLGTSAQLSSIIKYKFFVLYTILEGLKLIYYDSIETAVEWGSRVWAKIVFSYFAKILLDVFVKCDKI